MAAASVNLVTRFHALDLVSFHIFEKPADVVVDPAKITFQIHLDLNLNPTERKVTIVNPVEIFADASHAVKLGAISVKGEFVIENFEEIQVNNQLPIQVAATLIGVLLSSTRGMLKLMSKGSCFESAIIPILNPLAFLQANIQAGAEQAK